MTQPHAAISAPNALCTQAGAVALAAGGTAVDAAIAAMVTASVTEPGIVSPFGGAFVNVWPAHGEPVVVDGNVEMPGRGAPADRLRSGLIEVSNSYGGGLTTYVGPGSVATPGMFAAMDDAHRRFGAAPWRDLFEVAAHAARAGYHLSSTAQSYAQLVAGSIYSWDPATRATYTDDGRAKPVGALIRVPALADTLERLASAGAGDLYTGDLARAVAADMEQRGGLITAADLAAYRPVARTPLRTRLVDWDLACNPPPAIGGAVLTAMLRLVGDGSDRVTARRAAEVMRVVLDLRLRHVDVAPDLEVAGHGLLETIAAAGRTGLPASASTAHVSVVDSSGTACAITASAGYGSGMDIAGTGLIGNNALGELELNRQGLHALPPGTRMASNMAPTTARHRDGAVLAIGTPGADRITTALMQVLLHFCLHGEGLQEAVDRPRLHVRHLDDGTVRIDHERSAHLSRVLAEQPLPLHEHPANSMYFGGVGAALRYGDGSLTAASDPRRTLATAVL